MMSFVSYIIEIRQLFRKMRLILPLLKYILFLIPTPRLIYFSKILNNKITSFNSIFPFTKYSYSFRVNSKMSFNLISHHIYTRKDNCSHLFIEFIESFTLIIFYYIFECFPHIISLFTLLLNCEYYFVLNEVTLLLDGDISRQKNNQIDSSTHVDSPTYFFHNILP